MCYQVTAHGQSYVVRLECEFLDTQNSPILKYELKRLFEGRPRTVIVDFTTVRIVDSSGLGALLAAARVASRNGGQLRVAGLQPAVQETFELARLTRIFAIFPTQAEALAS
jgi:anti-sigma B factor antagonist